MLRGRGFGPHKLHPGRGGCRFLRRIQRLLRRSARRGRRRDWDRGLGRGRGRGLPLEVGAEGFVACDLWGGSDGGGGGDGRRRDRVHATFDGGDFGSERVRLARGSRARRRGRGGARGVVALAAEVNLVTPGGDLTHHRRAGDVLALERRARDGRVATVARVPTLASHARGGGEAWCVVGVVRHDRASTARGGRVGGATREALGARARGVQLGRLEVRQAAVLRRRRRHGFREEDNCRSVVPRRRFRARRVSRDERVVSNRERCSGPRAHDSRERLFALFARVRPARGRPRRRVARARNNERICTRIR